MHEWTAFFKLKTKVPGIELYDLVDHVQWFLSEDMGGNICPKEILYPG